MIIEQRITTLLATLIIAFSWVFTVSTLASEDTSLDGPVWLWSETSSYSNAAAMALGNGNTARGLRLAHKALEHAEDKRDRLIAHHNLCVAYAMTARSNAATRHCQAARRLADDEFIVTAATPRDAETDNLTDKAIDILEQNLAHVGRAGFGQIAHQ